MQLSNIWSICAGAPNQGPVRSARKAYVPLAREALRRSGAANPPDADPFRTPFVAVLVSNAVFWRAGGDFSATASFYLIGAAPSWHRHVHLGGRRADAGLSTRVAARWLVVREVLSCSKPTGAIIEGSLRQVTNPKTALELSSQ